MNQKLLIAIVVIILIAAGLWYWQSNRVSAPAESTGDDTSATISQELGTVDVGDLDREFELIDADLNSL